MATDDFILRFNLMKNKDDVELLVLVESEATKETSLKIFDFPCESHNHTTYQYSKMNLLAHLL